MSTQPDDGRLNPDGGCGVEWAHDVTGQGRCGCEPEYYSPDLIPVLLREIEAHDPSIMGTLAGNASVPSVETTYAYRNNLILQVLGIATATGWKCGIAPDLVSDDSENFWVLVYIELPGVGQVSWHLKEYDGAWDGHSTVEKYTRCHQFIAQYQRVIHRRKND